MAVVGGIITLIAVYGLIIVWELCFSVYLFTNRRKHEKEK